MRKAVLGGAMLAGALVLSPLGAGPAFAAGGLPPQSPMVACPAPTESDLSISADTPAAVDVVRGTAYETISLTTDVDLIPSVDFTVSPPAAAVNNADMSWSIDGEGETAGVFADGSGAWSEQANIGQLAPGAHTLVFGITFDILLGMPAGSYGAYFTWYAEESCPGVGFVSASSPTYTVPLPSLTYAPPTSAGGSGGGSSGGGGSGASGGQPTDGTSAAGASAAPSATASASANAAASASASGGSARGAGAVSPTARSTRSTEGTVTLTSSAPTSSDSTTVWMVVAVFLVMLAGSVASGFIVRRHRLALHGVPDGTPAGPHEASRSGAPPESDTGSDPGPLPPWTPNP